MLSTVVALIGKFQLGPCWLTFLRINLGVLPASAPIILVYVQESVMRCADQLKVPV